jgi:hypothetical protein
LIEATEKTIVTFSSVVKPKMDRGIVLTKIIHHWAAGWSGRGGTLLTRLNHSRWVEIQGRRPMPSNCSKCLSKAKALFSLRDLMMEKLAETKDKGVSPGIYEILPKHFSNLSRVIS